MTFTENMIQLINRDEKNHVFFFQKLVSEYMTQYDLYDKQLLLSMIYETVNTMVEEEIAWSNPSPEDRKRHNPRDASDGVTL